MGECIGLLYTLRQCTIMVDHYITAKKVYYYLSSYLPTRCCPMERKE